MIQRKLFALLVSDSSDCLEGLATLLKTQGIEVWKTRTCAEAARLLDQTHPDLTFTAPLHEDGTWRDIIKLAEKASVASNVIVVGRSDDYRLYVAAMDYGAFDFIIPPFESEPVAHVIRVAAESVRRRRDNQAAQAAA